MLTMGCRESHKIVRQTAVKPGSGLSEDISVAGLKEALEIGTSNAVPASTRYLEDKTRARLYGEFLPVTMNRVGVTQLHTLLVDKNNSIPPGRGPLVRPRRHRAAEEYLRRGDRSQDTRTTIGVRV